jgi:hypothetical protein
VRRVAQPPLIPEWAAQGKSQVFGPYGKKVAEMHRAGTFSGSGKKLPRLIEPQLATSGGRRGAV